ncbi:MAG: hypothetical protein WED33_08720 [Bacteroidia bacterium]
MKNILKVAAIAMIAVFIVACSGGAGPEGAAKGYLDALKAKDFEKAKEFSTEDSKGMLDFMKQLSAMGGEKEGEEAAEGGNYSDLKCTVEADTAAVCTYKTDEKEETLKLKKMGDKWLVHQPKETPEGMMGGEEMMEGGEMMENAGDEMMEGAGEMMEQGADMMEQGAEKLNEEADKAKESVK